MCCSTGCATRSPETSRLVAPRGVLWRNPTTPTTDGEANPQTTGWPSRADWYQSNAARSRLADFFQDTQNGTGIFSNQSSAGASSSGVPSLQPTPTSVPETVAEIVQQMDHSHQPTPAIPITRSITRADYELDIFGSTLGSDTVMSNDESTDTVKNDGEDAPLAETTSMLSDDCICYYRRTPDDVGRCCCYRCSEDTPDPWWTYRWASQPHEETAADARGVSGCQLPEQDN
jgi:hypothetical protein